MRWNTDSPKAPGKYVVETRTMMGRIQRIESNWNGKSWGFTNQLFVRYLDEMSKQDNIVSKRVAKELAKNK
jgi:hypothetical protein